MSSSSAATAHLRTLRARARTMWYAAVAFAVGGCSIARYEQRGAPPEAFDVVVVPGCPAEEGGLLSRCQKGRALWAATIWERGWARAFITSGAAVHSPYVEAEALAAAMVALGVPADRIWIEPDALHTDENMYDSLRIAQAIGARTIAVASSRGHAGFGCAMMEAFGQPCRSLPLDLAVVEARAVRGLSLLDAVRVRRVTPWAPPIALERAAARAARRSPRPPSFLLYPALAWMRLSGEPYRPPAPPTPPLVTFAELSRRHAAYATLLAR
jgi:uncharacterized SAM-binding protein YcdF (DUF218 family)